VQKPNSLLVDADIVIHCHTLQIWDTLIAKATIVVPSIIAGESKHFYSKRENRQIIDLHRQIAERRIGTVEASLPDFQNVLHEFSPAFVAAIHNGEREALAVLKSPGNDEWAFCTGDMNAIQAAGMLGIGNQMISFESLLSIHGMTKLLTKPLQPSLSEKTFQHHLQVGRTRRISREYFLA
jgi:hypothetical protein